MRVVFSIAGTPKGKERPRVVDGHAYTPNGTKDYEAMCAYMYKISARRRMFRGPIRAEITAIWTPPASARKAQLKLMQPGMPCCHKPDGDNIAKIILDSLNGIAWHDDAAVTEITVHKVYGRCSQVIVVLEDLEGEGCGNDAQPSGE